MVSKFLWVYVTIQLSNEMPKDVQHHETPVKSTHTDMCHKLSLHKYPSKTKKSYSKMKVIVEVSFICMQHLKYQHNTNIRKIVK
jgi:hypothetical protein